MLSSKEPILLSGGDGFIGKNIVKRLLNLDIPVIVIDNHVTSYPNIQSEHVKRFEEDVSTINISDVPTVSGVIHLASVASPLVYLKNPSSVLDPNTIGTRKMIEIAKRDNVRILFASTSEVYGNLNEEILGNRGIKESDNALVSLLSNRSCYAAAKRLGEELIWNFKKEGGDASIFRLFNVYGPGMDLKNTGYGRVIPNFIHNMLQGIPIQIFGDGTQIRSFLWIDDAVDAILSLFFFEKELPDVLNIGNDEPITILNLAAKISNILEVTYKTEYCDREDDDPLWRRPCIEKINKLTGWEPEINLDEGLRRTVLAEKTDFATTMSSNNAHLIDTQFSLVIDVTYRCNGNCSYCQWSTNQEARLDDETNSNILIPKKTIESLDVERVVLSGGEPLIRNDLEKIISYYAQTNVRSIILITNGLILTEERLDSLLSAGLTGITFSLDGISDRVAFEARGLSKEQHDLVLNNISKVLQRRKLDDNIEIGINAVISKANLDSEIMSKLVDFCNSHSVDCLKFNSLFDDGFVSKNAPWLLLDKADASEVIHIGEMVVRNCHVKTNHINFWTALASVLEGGELDATSCGLKDRQAIAIRGDLKFCFWNNNATYGQTYDQLNIENVMQARKRFAETIHLCQTGAYCFCLQNFNHQWRMSNGNHN